MTIGIPQTEKGAKVATLPQCPAVTIVEINDPTAVGGTIEVLRQDAVQLEPKPLRARRVVVRLETCLLIHHATNLALRTRTSLQRGYIAFSAFGPRASGSINGLPVGPDRVLASISDVEVEFVVAAGYESIVFLMPPDELQAILSDRCRDEPSFFPRGVALLRTVPATAAALYACWKRIIDAAAKVPQAFELPETVAAAREDLLESLLAVIESEVDTPTEPRDATRQVHSRIVQKVQDYVIAHPDKRLSITRLCESAGVCERTLQYAFREIMGMTPVAYLTRLRLHRVRQTLRAATPGQSTVTREALRWGFWHFGDFSRAYKECFGELPSATLRRKGPSPPQT